MPGVVSGGGSPAGPGSAKKGKGTPKGKKGGKGGAKKPEVKVAPMPHTPPEHRTPAHAVKYSAKKGIVFVHVNLPRSIPESVINLDARPDGFHLDTGKWGGGYKLDVPWPEGIKVHLKEGEEAEAELNGGNLKVCFYEEGGEALLRKQGKSGKEAGAKSIHKEKKRKSVEGASGKGGEADVPKPSKGEKQGTPEKAGVEKRVRGGSASPGDEERPQKKKKKTLVESKDLALKLVDDVSGVEEKKMQEKEDVARERQERVKQVQEKREERREAKKHKKEVLVKNLKAVSKKKATADDEADAPAVKSATKKGAQAAVGEGGDGDKDVLVGKKRRVSWGTDQVRKFHS